MVHAVALLSILAVAAAMVVPSEVISTAGGQLQGSCLKTADEYDGICTYAAIPFAAPPVKDLRWRPPQPAKPWAGVRKAVEFGHGCLQPSPEYSSILGSEDCLFLNVFAPPKANCPDNGCSVAFWIHGGAYTTGATDPAMLSVYNGTRNAALAKNIVFVTTQYRLNILGFAGSEELKPRDSSIGSTGNYGIQGPAGRPDGTGPAL
jgi:para-nitrobenzyl esterase